MDTHTSGRSRVHAPSIAVFLVIAMFVGGVIAIVGPAYVGLMFPEPRPIAECVTEDSTNCRWTPELHGNGSGRAFVDVDGVTYYDDEQP